MRINCFSFAIAVACLVFGETPARAQTWTTLTNPPPAGVGLCLLLTDGCVMCQAVTLNLSVWYKLTPDSSGSYLNGTWSSLAAMPSGYVPFAGATAVLADGRVLVLGGEYNNLNFDLSNMGALYDPVADSWNTLEPPPFPHLQCIGDAASLVLADGRFIVGSKLYQDLAILDPATLSWTLVAASGKNDPTNSEEGWTLLPDGSFFTLDVKNAPASERFLLTGAAQGVWLSSGNTAQALNTPGVTESINAPGCPVYHPAGEIGPTPLLPTGVIFAIGANGHTGIYTPPPAGSSATGTWVDGPTYPGNVEDGPAAVLPSGHVLFGSSPGAEGTGLQYFEFDGTAVNGIPAPANANADATTQTSLLLLPDGHVLFTDGSGTVQAYTPAASPTYNPSWAPTITSVPLTIQAGSTYQIAGTQFNGMGQGTVFGDENQNATNYPLVRIVNGASGHVFYTRTHDHSSMGVATGTAVVTTNFDVPADIEGGASSIEVVANGIPSLPTAVAVLAAAGTQAPTAITGAATLLTASGATLNGSVNPNGADTQTWFEYSLNSSMSGSFSTPPQDIGSGTMAIPIAVPVAGLAGSTTYYFRVVASSSAGTSRGLIANLTQTSGAAGYSSLGPDNSFSRHQWCVTGMNNNDCGPAETRAVAAPFTPGSTFKLGSVGVALTYGSGTNSAQILLLQDAGGAPGSTLESWTVNAVPGLEAPPLTTVADGLDLTLQAGQQYWVEVQAPAADTLMLWSSSSLGLGGALTDVNGSGWRVLGDGNGNMPAFNVGSGAPPTINSGGVISAGAFGGFTSVSPGGWIEIYGSNLAPDARDWTSGDFNGTAAPVELDGTSVTIGSQPAFVSFISPGQINVQVPYELATGQQNLIVTTPAGGASKPYHLAVASQPGLLAPPTFNIGGHQYVVALFPDYTTYVLPTGAIAGVNSRPAQPGDTILLFGVGFGQVTPGLPAGRLAGQLDTLAAPFQISFANTPAVVSYDGLAPGYAGLYQFNVVVPQIADSNLVPLTFTLGGSPGAQTLYIAVQ